MKCPKCAYVGFEATDRCRHCGYDFSFMTSAEADPTPRRAGDSSRMSSYREPLRAVSAADPDLVSVDSAPLVDLPLSAPPPVAAVTASLFADPQPPPARTPLAVRRTAERPRSRATPHVVRRPQPVLLDSPVDAAADSAATTDAGTAIAAPAAARIVSAIVDVALMAGIDTAVVYLTTQMAGVPLAEVGTLPLVPLAAFLLGLNVAYLTVFTANGGQTLGKMAMGLRVEATDGALTFGGAIVRVAATIAGGLAMGAGFMPALWRTDRRAVHDQIAHTRVVKVSAC